MARVYSSTSVATTLATTLTNVATSLTVTSGGGGPLIQGAGFANGDIFTIAIDPDTQSEEICYVTANSGDVFTITRAQAGTSAVAHASGATVRHVLTSADLVFFRDGVTTANAAIPASTLTTKGDLLSRTSATLTRLGVGSNGQVLSADSTAATGLAWTTPVNQNLTFNAKTANYSLLSTDVNKLVTMSNSSTLTVTVPNGVFGSGEQINVQGIGTGLVQIRNDGTTTLTSIGATSGAPNLRAPFSACTIVCTGTNTFTVIGDLA
jgi:hypothetical protein